MQVKNKSFKKIINPKTGDYFLLLERENNISEIFTSAYIEMEQKAKQCNASNPMPNTPFNNNSPIGNTEIKNKVDTKKDNRNTQENRESSKSEISKLEKKLIELQQSHQKTINLYKKKNNARSIIITILISMLLTKLLLP